MGQARIKGFGNRVDWASMRKLAVSLLFLAGCTGSVLAASDESAIEATFVKPWIEALRSKDKNRVEQFYHPATRACISPATKEFFDYVLDRETRDPLTGAYKVTKIAPLNSPPPTFLPGEGVRYPVSATYEVDIDFAQSNTTMVRFVAPSNGKWLEVYPCPNEKGMAFFRQQRAEGAQQQKKAAELLAALKDPLRGQLKDLLRREQKIDAIKKYRDVTSAHLTTAVMVINALQRSNQ